MQGFEDTQEQVLAARQKRAFDTMRLYRWRILRILDVCGTAGGDYGLIREIFERAHPDASDAQIKKTLCYLVDKGYVCLFIEQGKTVQPLKTTDCATLSGEVYARLAPAGVDFLANPDAVDDGISRVD